LLLVAILCLVGRAHCNATEWDEVNQPAPNIAAPLPVPAEVIRELVGACFPLRNSQNGSQSSSNHKVFADQARLSFIDQGFSLAFECTEWS
jgi:hypothetical protein